jgi:hypothetical protein
MALEDMKLVVKGRAKMVVGDSDMHMSERNDWRHES